MYKSLSGWSITTYGNRIGGIVLKAKELMDKEFVYLFVEKLYNILNNPVESILLEEIKILLIILKDVFAKNNITDESIMKKAVWHISNAKNKNLTPFEYQNSCRKKGKYALVPRT